MRTRKTELVSDNLKPFVGNIIKEGRIKYNYSLEDLAKALGHKKNRQTLHKYENGTLNIPYNIFFEICHIFNINDDILDKIPMTDEERSKMEKRLIKGYVNSMRDDNMMTPKEERIINTYKNASFESISKPQELSIKLLDDSMSPLYLKNDKIYFKKVDDYTNGDDIVIAIKNDVLVVRRLYRYPKGIILQALNPKYQTININIISTDMILGKVTAISREVK